MRPNVFIVAALVACVLIAGSCEKSERQGEGPAEKAGANVGKAIDRATEKAGQVMEKAGEALL